MWTIKKIFEEDQCRGFERETELAMKYETFAKKIKITGFQNLIKNEFFKDWKSYKMRFEKKIYTNGLRLAQKYFLDVQEDLEIQAVKSFFCKLRKFDDKAKQLRLYSVVKSKEGIKMMTEEVKDKEKFWKEMLLRTTKAQEFLGFVVDQSLKTKR